MKTTTSVLLVCVTACGIANAQDVMTGLLERAKSSQFNEKREAMTLLIQTLETSGPDQRFAGVLDVLSARYSPPQGGEDMVVIASLEKKLLRALTERQKIEDRELLRVLVQVTTNEHVGISLRKEALQQMATLAGEPEAIHWLVAATMKAETDDLSTATRTSLLTAGWMAVPALLSYCAANTSSDMQSKGARLLIDIAGRDAAIALVKSRLATMSKQSEKDNLGALLKYIQAPVVEQTTDH